MGLFSFLFGGDAKKGSVDTNAVSAESGRSVTNPWGRAVPYLTEFLNDTKRLYDTRPLVGSLEQRGLNYLTTAAGQTRQDVNAATDENQRVMSGEYLTPDTNPYLKDIATRISGIAGSNANTTFGGRGRTGSGLAGYYSGKGVGDSLTDMYGNVYEAERGRMMDSIDNSTELASARMVAPSILTSAGENITNRPFQRNAMQGGLYGAIAGLGESTDASGVTRTSGTSTQKGRSSGLLGSIFNSALNKVFDTSFGTS